MIYKGKGILKFQEGEPAIRSCWNCNKSHMRLKYVNWLHWCYECGRFWVLGEYVDKGKDGYSSKEAEAFLDDFFLNKCGMKKGGSTWEVEPKKVSIRRRAGPPGFKNSLSRLYSNRRRKIRGDLSGRKKGN